MKEIPASQYNRILYRFPNFELSYEMVSHKKVSNKYDVCFAIPTGKKYYAWLTYHNDTDICYILELNKDKKIVRCFVSDISFDNSLALGTVLYGILTEDMQTFIIEDILYYKGISLAKSHMQTKLGFMYNLLDKYLTTTDINYNSNISFMLPLIWNYNSDENKEDNDAKIPQRFLRDTINAYTIHHLQYRSLTNIVPYINIVLIRKMFSKSANIVDTLPNASINKSTLSIIKIPPIMCLNKSQYKYPTVFQIQADLQTDIYHLYAFGKNKSKVHYNIAYIPNYKTSVMMNGIFRNIKENRNLDYIEESEDEEDFENTCEDRFVDLHKIVTMECIFNAKFKKWIPVKIVNDSNKVVHIGQLVAKNVT